MYEVTPVGIENDRWQLYNLSEDPAELNDLAAEYPKKLEELIGTNEVDRTLIFMRISFSITVIRSSHVIQ